ncbi:MAG: FlgD immunoglobulin-like domain containing protein [bacterium]
MLWMVFILPFMILPLITATVFSQDTTYVYGGPGSLAGKFETAAGEPVRQEWLGVDLHQKTTSYWHIDTYNCANLDPGHSVNHAWWCGDYYPSCGGDDPEGGYGTIYEEYLDYYAEITDDQTNTIITVNAVLNHDTEPGYDFLYLEAEDAAFMQTWAVFNYKEDSVVIDVSITFYPEDYVPHPDTGNPACHLRWRGDSDGAWDDEDCDWPTAGLAQIDNIVVSGDNGVVTVLEDCEGNEPAWKIAFPPAFGDFSQVWPLLDDLDPVAQNNTPQIAFIDDGIVVPGTGGQHCTTWCYGPGGFCVNAEGGLMGPDYDMLNEIWSPPIALPFEAVDVVALAYEVYIHSARLECPWVVDAWRVRTTTDPAGTIDWSTWSEAIITEHVYEPQYFSRIWDLTDHLAPGCCFLQVALGAYDICEIWSYEFDPTPAPYFDNVSVYTVSGLSGLPERECELWLAEPVPNPFNPSTMVKFSLQDDGRITVTIHDLRGQLICTLLDEQKRAGTHAAQWDGRDENGELAAAGTYLFRLETGGKTVTKKGILVK